MTLAWPRIWVSSTKEGKRHEGKTPKKQQKYENELAQKEALQVGRLSMCRQKKNNK
jgi:hypothetical protein